MPRRLPQLNLTALLALAALVDLVLYRVLGVAFLPAHPSTVLPRILLVCGAFASNLAGVLGLSLVAIGLVRGLSGDRVFPRSMRITVSTIGLFFCMLAAMGVFWFGMGPRYHVHLRISHGFLVLFLMLGIWRGARPWRVKLALTLFALPIVLEALAVFCQRMAWARVEPALVVRAAHVITWAAMIATPVLLAPPMRKTRQLVWAVATAVALGAGLGAAVALRFDVVQAVAYYGLQVDLTGLGSWAEQIYTAAMVVAFACLGSATLSCLVARGPYRLVGWGLLLLAACGGDLSLPKTALFSLCGLLAIAVATRSELVAATSGPPRDAGSDPHPVLHERTGVPVEIGQG